MNWTLRTSRSFILEAVIQSHGWSQLEPFRVLEPTGLSCILLLPGGSPVEVSVRQPGRSIAVSTASSLTSDERQYVDDRLHWMLRLGQDLEPFYAVARTEPKLAHAEENGYGRMLRSASLFEDITKTILTTNTTWAGTKRMTSRLIDIFGHPVPGVDDRRAFPLPRQLASAPVETLRKDVGLGYRAPYISELASRVHDGSLNLESFTRSEIPTDELRKRLLAIKGVGPYAAATLLMLLGRYDFLPVDSWAFRLVSTEFHDGEPVGKAEVETAFEHWGEWKALAYWFWDWDLLRQTRE